MDVLDPASNAIRRSESHVPFLPHRPVMSGTSSKRRSEMVMPSRISASRRPRARRSFFDLVKGHYETKQKKRLTVSELTLSGEAITRR
jgi:hypothetical protein